jgi:pimeloyl-ACP methyl ester carboxylesterase
MSPPPGGWDERARLAREQGLEPFAKPMTERMFSSEYRQSEDPFIDTMRSVFLHTNPQGYASAVAVLRDADLHTRLADIQAPTLVVTGTRDALIPSSAARIYCERIRGARHVEMDSGHFPPIETPDAFASAVLGFAQ